MKIKVGTCIITILLFISSIAIASGNIKEPLSKVSFAYSPSPYSAPIYVAENKGYFIEEGLIVELTSFVTGRECLQSLLGGKADFATVADMPIMRVGFTDQKIAIISTIAESNLAIKIIARKDKGISSPSDLKGKKIGTFFGTASEFFLSIFLDKSGISKNEIIKINVGPANMPTTIIQGDLDAYSIWEPYIQYGFEALKDNAIVFKDSTVYTLTWNILSSPAFLDNNGDSAKKLLKALIKAENFIKENPEEAINITASKIGMKPEVLHNIWDDYIFDNSLKTILIEVIERQSKWAVDNDRSLKESHSPNYRKFLYPSILKNVKPESVKIN